MLRRSDSIYWLWLSMKIGNRNAVFQKLRDVFGEYPYDIYKATESELFECGLLTKTEVERLCDKDIGKAISVLDYCNENGVGLMTYNDPKYPNMLKRIKNPPMVLYYIGTFPDMNRSLSIAVVGTRKMTEYGMRSAYKISYELASARVVTVSGMALGIDSVAAAGAIAGGGKTVAVLGCGIDVIYPKQHRKLRNIISNNGAVVTAYLPGTPAYKNNFPDRNQIISGMSDGTLIVEAPMHSGAMLTAASAEEQSRVVYALPGSIEEPTSEGPNHLIKNVAVPVTCARDILDPYFSEHSSCVDPVRFRIGECNSDFDSGILETMGVSLVCSGSGSKESPKALLRKLNETLNSNEGQNRDYYNIPKIKRLEKQSSEDDNGVSDGETDAILESLDEKERKIFSEFPAGTPISADELAKAGYSIGDLMSSLTLLEINGLISSLPGGLYIKR